MEKKQSKTPDLEIKKAPESLTEQDLNNVTGGVAGGKNYGDTCGKNCFTD